MKEKRFTLEVLLFCLAILIAFSIRFIKLGSPALTESEASLGLQAYQSVTISVQHSVSHTLYTNLTGDLFWIFSSSNFWARFLSAVSGTLLCVAPIFLRKRLGSVQAICLSFILAVEPSLVAASRQVGSAMLSICTLAFAIIFILDKKPITAGILVGLSLLTGSSVWVGWISFGLTILIIYLLQLSEIRLDRNETEEEKRKSVDSGSTFNYSLFAIALIGSLLVFGSNFFIHIGNLSGLIGALIGYFKGWGVHQAGWWQSLKVMSISIFIFGAFNVVFGLTGIIKGLKEKDRKIQALTLWFVILFVLTILYPAHSPIDSVWIFLPLSIITALTLPKVFQFSKKDHVVQISISVIMFTLFIFAWLNAIWILQNYQYDPTDSKIHLAATIGALLLIVIICLLVLWGWSWKTAKKGLLYSSFFVLIFLSLSMTRRVTGLGSYPETNPFLQSSFIAESDLLKQTINDISLRNHGVTQTIDILVVGDAPDSLIWALKDYQTVNYQNVLSPGLSPSLVITTTKTEPTLAFPYRGQRFSWQITPDWKDFGLMDWFRWVALQSGTTNEQEIFLWARNDLFPTTLMELSKLRN
jgi:hypothetical protein